MPGRQACWDLQCQGVASDTHPGDLVLPAVDSDWGEETLGVVLLFLMS